MVTIDSHNLVEPINNFVIGRHLVGVITNIIIMEDKQTIIIKEGIIVMEGITVVVKVDTVVIKGGINCSLSIFIINIYSNKY